MLTARGLTKAWDGQAVIDGLDLEVAEGQHTLIFGPSGSGKSTLLYLLARLLAPDAGELRLDDKPYEESGPARAFRLQHIGLIFQDFHLLESLTARQNIELVAAARARAGAPSVAELCAPLGIAPRLDARVNTLSRGERQRVALARAFANVPRLVLADEPTASLDPTNRSATLDHLFALCARMGATCVAVAHDPVLAERPEFQARWQLQNGALRSL